MKAWERNIRSVEPYVPGEQPKEKNVIKLNTNESPYPPSPKVTQVQKELDTEVFRLYPDTEANPLAKELAGYYGMNEDQVFVGVGSDDVLGMAFMTFFNSDKPILFPDITYSFYDVWAELYRIPYEQPKLNNNFKIQKEDYYKENGGVVIANPNAPTSIGESKDFIEDIVKHNQDVVVIVDEAYVDFGGESVLSLVDQYENLLVVQTFSKSRAMAGMRIGYCFGNKDLIQAMKNVKYSYNSYTMNMPSILTGIAAIKDDTYFHEMVAKIVKTRDQAKERFEELGFHVLDSKTNFLFVSHQAIPATEIFTYLKAKRIFVRHFDKPRINNYLRVTIGTDEQMETLFQNLKTYINEYHKH
ncbi:histidinol-phosphate aminotransferase [Lachnospiraceae bacterium KM106-2]|nr:histidinol-phosphate aminotransferase [Lachnospiraceae bacterium KM106-2]